MREQLTKGRVAFAPMFAIQLYTQSLSSELQWCSKEYIYLAYISYEAEYKSLLSPGCQAVQYTESQPPGCVTLSHWRVRL